MSAGHINVSVAARFRRVVGSWVVYVVNREIPNPWVLDGFGVLRLKTREGLGGSQF